MKGDKKDMKKETLFIRIIEAVKATGAEARMTVISAGLYYDGTQHGELIDCIFVSVDKYNAGRYNGDAARIAAEARKAAGRFKGVSIKEESHPSFYIYIITTSEDRARADALNAEAHIYLEAFWNEEHRQHISGETANHGKAIEAGHAALIAAGYTITAATAEGTTAA